jgi:RimJ/RimL family protein N-acetyltransferase
MILTTDRLVLREFVESDWEAVLAYQSDPRYLRYYEWEKRTAEDVRAFVQMFIDYQNENPRNRFQLAVTLKSNGQLIGNCGVRRERADSVNADLGYELAPDQWGHGYATEAARTMLAFGFQELGAHRIWAHCIAENVASARVLEKIGMKCEGRLRENEWFKGRSREITLRGNQAGERNLTRWWDTLLYGILEQEWVSKGEAFLENVR